MTDLERQQRQQVVDEAKSWLGTPHINEARVKGAGVDCGMLVLETFERCGLVPHTELPHYSNEWHLHHSEEQYLDWVSKFGHEVKNRDPLPGDVILYQYGRCISHGAIVVDYPTIIHAYIRIGVVYADATQNNLSKRQRAIYSFWPEG